MQEVVKQIISDPSSMSLLLRGGLHKKSKLVGGLSASTTKQRAQAIRSGQLKPKKEEKVTPDAIYRSVRLLPKQIDYGYQQRQRRREAQLSQENTRLRELPSSATATATARQGRGGSEALKVIDVSFFVLESVIKATGPLLSDRGQLAWSRIVDTFPAALKKKEDSWQLFGQFKKPSSSSPPSK
eukprot:gene8594-9470_t